MICRALPLLSPSGLFQASAVRGNLSGRFSEIESASQRVDGRGRGRGSQCFVLDNNWLTNALNLNLSTLHSIWQYFSLSEQNISLLLSTGGVSDIDFIWSDFSRFPTQPSKIMGTKFNSPGDPTSAPRHRSHQFVLRVWGTVWCFDVVSYHGQPVVPPYHSLIVNPSPPSGKTSLLSGIVRSFDGFIFERKYKLFVYI